MFDHVISVHWLHLMFFYVCGMVFHMNKIITTTLCVHEIIFLTHREPEMVQQKCWGSFPLYWLTSWHFRLKLVENDGFAELLDCFISLWDALWLSRLFWAPSVTFIPNESPLISFMPTTDGQAVPFSLKVVFFCSSSLSREQCCFLCT